MKNPAASLLLLFFLAAPAGAAESVPELYVGRCAMCHLPGIAGAPKVGDRDEWTRRVRSGINSVYRNTLQGVENTAMMAKGGHTDLSDAQIRAIVDYMLLGARLSPEALQAAARYDKLNISNRDFIRLDADFDGFLSRGELAGDAVLAQNLGRFDANGDGRLSIAEYENAEATLERERMAVKADDGSLIVAVRSTLAKIKGIDIGSTRIESNAGAVAVIGVVEDHHAALRAIDAVKRIPGIQRITNRLVSGDQIGWD
jgi:cytochrome c5